MSPFLKSDNLGKYTRIRTGKLDANANDPDGAYPFFTCAVEPLRISTFGYDCECVLIAGNGDLNAKYYNGKFDAYQRTYIVESIDKTVLDVRYLYYFLSTYMHKLREMSIGGVIKYIKLNYLTDVEIPLPPLPEQKRIAAILDKADSIRRKRQEAVRLTEELLRSVFLDMFGDPANNPMRFPHMTIGELASKFSDGPFGSNLKSSHYRETGVRVVRLQNIGVGKFLDDDKAFISDQHFSSLKKHECRPGDILVGTMGDPNLRACIQPDWLDLALNKADCVQFRPNEHYANAPYLCALLNQPETESMAQDLIAGQTRLRISMGRLRGLRVPVPPLNLQHKFAQRIATIEKIRTAHKGAQTELDILFNSLLQRAFRGEISQ